ncbi:cell wall hydrolase [Roseovarius nitratireducens]|uniref:cell wall hydrolase n=1 Tax=Roseovarius nitratireducens TaxID=2044597 RepID=UPI000CE1E671|nr:cell wall hydrolase [Roseovarius nitratireducens]
MAFGSFLSGLAGGISSGENLKERRKERGVLESLAKQGGDGDHKRPGEEGYKGTPPFVPDNGGAGGRAGGGAVPENERDLLALTLDAEAGGEGYDGMLAAGSVIANRAKEGGYGGDVKQVIMKPGQFSAWNSVTGYAGGEGGLDMSSRKPSQDAYRVADAILSGDYRDPTGGATHYYNPAAASPKWGQDAGGNWHRIGNHVFGRADAGRDRYAGPSSGAASSTPKPTERGVMGRGESLVTRYYR